jgi:hypothetical protein
VAHIAGISLNDAELPPASGITVALNEEGPITIDWNSPVTQFTALFTYTAPLTVNFFLSGVPVGNSTSAFGNNLALSGDPGSLPNEPISFSGGGTFDSIRIDSDGQYGVDDIFFDTAAQDVPEPANAAPVLLICLVCVARRVCFRAWR